MVQRLVRSQEMNSSRVESLQRIDPKQLARFLEGEHPQDYRADPGTPRNAPGFCFADVSSSLRFAPSRFVVWRTCASFLAAMAEKVAMVLNRRLRSVGEQKKKTYLRISERCGSDEQH